MQRLLYILLYPFLWLTSVLPMPLLYLKSTCLYFLAYYVIRYRKKVVLNNLRLVFPEKTEAERKQIAKLFYKHLCDLIFESIKGLTISEAEASKRFVFENLELVRSQYENGRSILLLCGHYANWEWSGILNKQNPYEGFAVYKKLDNPYFDRLVKKIRGRFGPAIISNKKIVSTLFRLQKEDKRTMTLIVADQTPKPGAFKHRDTFMGIEVPVFTGTEELARKLDFTTLYLKTEKIKRGYYKATFVRLVENPSDLEEYQITRLFLDEIEKQIKKAPQFYLWSHKRWKHRTIKP